jgi:dimethylhistidine N-methyltransferase
MFVCGSKQGLSQRIVGCDLKKKPKGQGAFPGTAMAQTATPISDALYDAVMSEALRGLRATPKTLSPWLFYDERGSQLFEAITELPEYYLTRTERAILAAHADEALEQASQGARLTLMELGAGTAAKTGLLLAACVQRQGSVLYQPVDVSASALEAAAQAIAGGIDGVVVEVQTANYTTEPFTVSRLPGERALALYIGSSIGNFSAAEAEGILRNLREHLEAGDSLLLGTDLAPGKHKPVQRLLAAYDDAQGVTAAFNKNVLLRLNRELDADFDVDAFAHRACWNAEQSRIEMHLQSLRAQTVHIGGQRIVFAKGETIHTENSYKFALPAIDALLEAAGFRKTRVWCDAAESFAVTLAEAV